MAKYTKAEVDKMTSEQYRNLFDTDPEFRVYIDGEYNAAPSTATRPAGNVRGPEPTAQPVEKTFDPSFDDEEQPAPVAAPVAVQPVAQPAPVAELPEKIHEYQPVDRNGRPVGGKQVFKYRTDAELIEKLTKAHSASSARIRELSRDRKLDSIAAAGAAPRIQPEKEVPTTVEGLAAELRAQREQNFLLSVREALNTFQLSVDWSKYRSNENAKSVVLAVERAGDDPTDPQSYHRAFHNMEQFLEPVAAAPVAATVEPTPAPAPVAPAPKAAPAVHPSQRVGISTGLSISDETSLENPAFEPPIKVVGVKLVMPDGKTQVMTFAAYDRLSTDVQKRILRNAANANAVESLYTAENERRAAARGGR
jgi:hypothetical protein